MCERDVYPAILDRATFDAVQAKLERRARKRQKPKTNSTYLLSGGTLICGHCGQSMSGTRYERKRHYYRRQGDRGN